MPTDAVDTAHRLSKAPLNLTQLIQSGRIRLNVSVDIFLVPLIIYKVTHHLRINNSYLHVSLMAAIMQLFVINNLLLCIFPPITLLIFFKSPELPKFTLLCVILYIIFANIGYGKLNKSEICIISQLITTLFYMDGKLEYENFTLVLVHKLTLNITIIVILFSIFLYAFKSTSKAIMISQLFWYTTWDWLMATTHGITPLKWAIKQILDNIPTIIIWGGISFLFISFMLLKLKFKRDGLMVSSLRKDIHFLLSSIVIVSMYLNKLQLVILALDSVLLIFLLVEMIRYAKIQIVTEKLQHLRIFYNERDSDELLFIHIFLIIGLMVPLITSLILGKGGIFNKWILGCLGVYAIGLADSMASIIGGKIFSPVLPLSHTKTICGSISFFTVLFISIATASYINRCFNAMNTLIIAFISTLYEVN